MLQTAAFSPASPPQPESFCFSQSSWTQRRCLEAGLTPNAHPLLPCPTSVSRARAEIGVGRSEMHISPWEIQVLDPFPAPSSLIYVSSSQRKNRALYHLMVYSLLPETVQNIKICKETLFRHKKYCLEMHCGGLPGLYSINSRRHVQLNAIWQKCIKGLLLTVVGIQCVTKFWTSGDFVADGTEVSKTSF